MSPVPQITDLAKVLEQELEAKLISYSSEYLTKPGDNYGSVMLRICANIRSADGDESEELPLVAKLPPLTNDLYWQIFHPERTCRTENAMYKLVAPALKRLQLAEGVADPFEGFSKYYGSRISLNANAISVDRDAVLLLENLQVAGYRAGDRHRMYDEAHTRLLLQQLAQFHALPIALRIQRPQEFEQLVRPYTRRFNMNDNMSPEMTSQLQEELFTELKLATNNNDNVLTRLKELQYGYDAYLSQSDAKDTLYTSVIHCDLWINNIMILYDANGAPNKVKFVDFQLTQYESIVHDIAFFLFTSVASDLLAEQLEELLHLYYLSFVNCLQSVGVPIAQYTFDAFKKEFYRVAPIELPHALFMTKVILADNSTMPADFKDMNLSVLTKNSGVAEIVNRIVDILSLAKSIKILD